MNNVAVAFSTTGEAVFGWGYNSIRKNGMFFAYMQRPQYRERYGWNCLYLNEH